MGDGAADSSTATDPTSGLTAASSAIHDTAKWLVAGLGALGAAFAAGIQLTSLGSLTDPVRLGLAVISVVACILALAWAIARTVTVLLPTSLNLREVAKLGLNDEVSKYLSDNASEYFEGEATTAQAFYELYGTAITDRVQAIKDQHRDEEARKAAVAADNKVVRYNAIAQKVTGVANLIRLRGAFTSWRRQLIGSMLVVAFSIALFGWAANPPKADTTAGLDLSGASLVGADLSKGDLSGADLTRANLTNANLSNTKLDGATLAGVIWGNTTCPDGSNSDKVGGTCAADLK